MTSYSPLSATGSGTLLAIGRGSAGNLVATPGLKQDEVALAALVVVENAEGDSAAGTTNGGLAVHVCLREFSVVVAVVVECATRSS